jgi:hypothetical protein
MGSQPNAVPFYISTKRVRLALHGTQYNNKKGCSKVTYLKQVGLTTNPQDHKTLSIWCHVGFHVTSNPFYMCFRVGPTREI